MQEVMPDQAEQYGSNHGLGMTIKAATVNGLTVREGVERETILSDQKSTTMLTIEAALIENTRREGFERENVMSEQKSRLSPFI